MANAVRLPRVRLMTLHASGGLAVMRAAREAIEGKNRPALLAVTVLTSFEHATLREIGVRLAGIAGRGARRTWRKRQGWMEWSVRRWKLRQCGGSSAQISRILVPGVRPATTATNDQSRVATPGDAVAQALTTWW